MNEGNEIEDLTNLFRTLILQQRNLEQQLSSQITAQTSENTNRIFAEYEFCNRVR